MSVTVIYYCNCLQSKLSNNVVIRDKILIFFSCVILLIVCSVQYYDLMREINFSLKRDQISDKIVIYFYDVNSSCSMFISPFLFWIQWEWITTTTSFIIFKMSTCKFLLVVEFSTRNLDIPTRILLVLYSEFRALD